MDIFQLTTSFADFGKDARLNLQSVLAPGNSLTPAQRWGSAVAAAATARNPQLLESAVASARAEAGDAVVDDALAAASLMAMNNVYYRFRHVVGKPSYGEKPARLRMQRIAKPATNKLDFELFCLVASAINNCEACVRSHEAVVTAGGMSEDVVHDAVRVGAVVHAVAVTMELSAV
jgi:alkyl hydroperoxide reductase subunit D